MAKGKPHYWHKHYHRRRNLIHSFRAKHEKKRSVTQRVIDRIAAFSGSVPFLLANAIVFLFWILLNTNLLGIKPFDPFPFVLLTTIVSLEAIFLSIFVLISQNHQARLADLREEIDLQINVISEQEITKMLELLIGLYRNLNLKIEDDEELQSMMKHIDTDEIEKALNHQME